MKEQKIDTICLQETHGKKDWELKLRGSLIFHHGPPEQPGVGSGGVAIILGTRAIAAWKKVGQPEPKRWGPIGGTYRLMSIELHVLDHLNKV